MPGPLAGDERAHSQQAPAADADWQADHADHAALLAVVSQALMDQRLEAIDARLLLVIGQAPTISVRDLAQRCRCQVKTARAGIERLAGTEYVAPHRKMQGQRVVGTLYVVRGMRSTLPHQMELFGPHLPVKKKDPDSSGPGRKTGGAEGHAASVRELSPVDRLRRRVQQAATKPGWSYAKAIPVVDAAIARAGFDRVAEFAETLLPESQRPWQIEAALRSLAPRTHCPSSPPDQGQPAANDAGARGDAVAITAEIPAETACDAELLKEAEYIVATDRSVHDMLRLSNAIRRAGGTPPPFWHTKRPWVAAIAFALAQGALERPTRWMSRPAAA